MLFVHVKDPPERSTWEEFTINICLVALCVNSIERRLSDWVA